MRHVNIDINKNLIKGLGENDLSFLKRVYSKNINKYRERIKMIGFEDKNAVLDAGCGFGQWLFSLADMNKKVVGIDFSQERVDVCKEIAQKNNINNVEVIKSSITNTELKEESFDAIFSYSSIYFTDYRKTLKEFYRLLKKGGVLYFTTNSWGKYISDIINNPYPTSDFYPRWYAIKTIWNTFKNKREGFSMENGALVMSKKKTKRIMQKIGFYDIRIDYDGHLCTKDREPLPLVPETYIGMTHSFEVLARK